MKPTQAQLNLAAKLFTLSMAVSQDETSDSESGNRVRRKARNRALKQLDYLGVDASDLRTDEMCLITAMQLKN